MSEPALGVIELDSIATGVRVADAMVKDSPVAGIHAGSVQPGRYIIVVTGDTASVQVALDRADVTGAEAILATAFLPDIHEAVLARLRQPADVTDLAGQALAIVETDSIASAIEAADAGVKAAVVSINALVLGDGLGGRAYFFLSGEVADVEASHEAAVDRAGPHLRRSELISQLHDDMAANIQADLHFNPRLSTVGST